jgi:hypothetical protein
MPPILGLELHALGFSLASVGAGLAIGPLALDDRDGVFAHTAAHPWKWALGGDGDLVAVVTAGQFLEGVEEAAGAGAPVVVAIPSAWGDRPRRSLSAALERTTLDALRFARESSALVVGASVADESLSGVCATVDVGAQKAELALAEVTSGMLRVLARESVTGDHVGRLGVAELLSLIEQIGRRVTSEAGLEPRDVERVVATGRRTALPTLARGVEALWGIPPEPAPPGSIARGAARVAAGLAGVLPPWLLDDDLGEEPLARLRPAPRRSDSAVPVPRTPVSPGRTSSPLSSDRAVAAVSDHPSVAPLDGPVTAMPASGRFVGLPSLDAVRALDPVHAVTRPLDAPPLVALLNQFTFLRALTGTLTLRTRDDSLALPVDRGGACVSQGERPRALRLAEWPEGTFAWREEPLPTVVTKHRTPMTAFVVAAIRVRMRGFDDPVFAEAYAAKMALSPSVARGRRGRLERLALPEAEHRAVDHVVDGTRSLQTMLDEGYIGRMTLHRLVLLLDLYGILEWAPPTFADAEDPVEAMARTLAAMQRGNHFVALGVRWGAGPEEIQAAWDRMRTAYSPEGRWARHDAAAAAAIVKRGGEAWAVLREDRSRVQHRRESYEGMDEALLAPLVDARARALEMRGESAAAAEMSRLRKEFEGVLPKRGRRRPG